MLIRIEREGGFSGIPQRISIETRDLEASEGQAIEALVTSLGFFDLPARIGGPGGGADRFVYVVDIASGSRRQRVEVGESAAPAGLNELIRRVTVLARGGGRA